MSKKIILLCGVFIFFLINILLADFTWHDWQDNLPNKNCPWNYVASSGDGQKVAAVVYGGYIYTSIDGGITWTARISAGTRSWWSITSSQDGMKLAAVAKNDYIYTSADGGVTWTAQTSAGSRGWSSITSSQDGQKLAATEVNGYIYTSTDGGTTWTERTSAENKYWFSITSSQDGMKLAVAVHSGGYIYTSTDGGATWIERTSAGSRNWASIASSQDGMKLAAAAQNGYIYTSTDGGATWIERTSAGSKYWVSIVSSQDGQKLAAAEVDGGHIHVSTDGGITWIEKTSAGYRYWRSIASSQDGMKLVGLEAGDTIYHSTDGGTTWTAAQTSVGSRKWASIASSQDGMKLAALVQMGYIYTSTDGGTTWTERTSAGNGWWISISSSQDGMKLAAAQQYGYIYTSTDGGTTWIARASAGSRGWNSITSSQDGIKLAAVNGSGYIYTSTDGGATWTERTSAGSRGWSSITSSQDGIKLAAVEQDGYIYTSIDGGATWMPQTSAGSRTWVSITSSQDGMRLAAVVQYSGLIYTSINGGVTWIAQTSAGNRNWQSITSSLDGTKLAAVIGHSSFTYCGYIYTSTDGGTTWTEQNSLGNRNWQSITYSGDGTKIAACAQYGGMVLGDSGSLPPVSGGATAYIFTRNNSSITYTRVNQSAQQIAQIAFDESLLGLSGLTTENMQPMVSMTKAASGKLYLNVTGDIAATVNAANGNAWVTANFVTNRLRPIIMNGVQISNSKGQVFPTYRNYIDNISFSGGILTFQIKHFTEYGVPALEAKTFAGSGAGLNINALGANIIAVVPPGNSFAGTSLQNTTTSVAKISGLAYETVLSDIPSTMNNLYKPLTPGSEYGISFEYINRGNAIDTANISLVLTTANVGHFGYNITTNSQAVTPWQVLLFDVKVNANNANAFERATLDATVDLPLVSAVSYNAFANAYLGGTFEGVSGNGTYGGVKNLNHMFILEAEGYNVAVLSRTATINVPAGYTGSPEDMVPGSKVIYSISIKNNSTAIATSVNVADQIANNCHLYYTDNPAVEGATAWVWKGVTNNNATSADTNAVKFEITIPANGVVTASYTVTLD